MPNAQRSCVCGHDAAEHHAWTGHCHGTCGCSYYLELDGIEPPPAKIEPEPYTGIYNQKYSA